jgi:hypothetical protein
MAKFPVEVSDQDGIVEAVNNLLSGPSGLGQNFAGFSSYAPGWLTSNFRVPYTQATAVQLYVAPIAITQSEMLDSRTFKFTFATEQSAPPFINGNNINIENSDNGFYDGSYSGPGVIQCTTSYVIVRTISSYAIQPASPNGEVFLYTGASALSTDANAKVTVTGGGDRVFISGQIDNVIGYEQTENSTLTYTVQIQRYYGFPNNDPTNPEFRFNPDGDNSIIAQKIYTYPGLNGSGSIPLQETIFTAIFDTPNVGYYWYILETGFEFTTGPGEINSSEFGLRSLSAQVVKQ